MPEPTDTPREVVFVAERQVPKWNTSSCVIFARQYTGRDDIKGYAGDLKPTTDTPYIGGVVLFRTHVAVITDIQGDTLSLIEANWLPNRITTRKLNIEDLSIKGYR